MRQGAQRPGTEESIETSRLQQGSFFYKELYFIPTYSYSKVDVISKSDIAKAIVKAPRRYFTERGVVRCK